MQPKTSEQRMVWLGMGLAAGLCLAYFWPHELAQAVATDRADRFAICTVDVGTGNPDAVFVLDFLTGRLLGAMLSQQTGLFTNFWSRNIASDFQIQGESASKAKYVIIPGNAGLNSFSGATTAQGVIYIGELTSGKIAAYRFPFRISKQALPVHEMVQSAFFSFREETRD